MFAFPPSFSCTFHGLSHSQTQQPPHLVKFVYHRVDVASIINNKCQQPQQMKQKQKKGGLSRNQASVPLHMLTWTAWERPDWAGVGVECSELCSLSWAHQADTLAWAPAPRFGIPVELTQKLHTAQMPRGEALRAWGQGNGKKLPGCTRFLNWLALDNFISFSTPWFSYLKRGIIIWLGGLNEVSSVKHVPTTVSGK